MQKNKVNKNLIHNKRWYFDGVYKNRDLDPCQVNGRIKNITFTEQNKKNIPNRHIMVKIEQLSN